MNIERKTGLTFTRWAMVLVLHGIVASTSSFAVDYYVGPSGSDSNAGTSPSAPWATIGKAAATMNAGDTTTVQDGTYTEPQISFAKAGTASLPITLRAEHKHQAILSSTSGCSPNISLYNSYIIIEGLRSQISSSNVTCSPLNSASGAAIRAWEGSVPTLLSPATGYKGCVIRDMLIDYSAARGVGIKINQDYCLVENNVIYSSLQAFNNTGTVFRGNEIHGHDTWGTSLFGKGGVRNLEIYNNVVYVTAGTAQAIIIGGESDDIYLFDPTAGFEAYNSVAYNNVVVNDTGNSVWALGMMSAKDSALFNNVVVGRGFLYLDTSNEYPYTVTENPTIKNNIFSCDGYSVRNTSTLWAYTGTLDLDYNNFYDCLDEPSQTNAVTGDPLFIDPASDWHVDETVPSPVIGTGTPVTMPAYGGGYIPVDTDKDGNPREDNWDLGVYENPGC